jgi:glycosyltransferase involved in cell wall biosynthesis
MLTVLIATRNGADTLPEVLAAYRRLESPAGGWNIVIVDNASSDTTRNVVQTHSATLPLTYHFVATPGKNAALNAGLARVSGDLVVLTDDDVIPRPDWLRQFRAAADSHAEFDFFGGRIVARWPSPPDPWLLRVIPISPVFGVTPAEESGPVRESWVFGGNMAVRRRLFDTGYRFDPTIGPRGSDYAQGSEAEFTRRLAKAGYKAWHCYAAVVEHIIQPHQMTEAWILERARRYGRGQYRLDPDRTLVVPVLGIPARLAFSLAKPAIRLGLTSVRSNREALFRARWTWNLLLGKVSEARLEQRSSATVETRP